MNKIAKWTGTTAGKMQRALNLKASLKRFIIISVTASSFIIISYNQWSGSFWHSTIIFGRRLNKK